jgi:acylglycerol lipase
MPSRSPVLALKSILIAVVMVVNVFFSPPVNAANVVRTDDPQMLRGLGIPTYVWQRPGSRPEAILVGFHGGCLHGKAYNALATEMAERDIMFVSFDMRGYGKWYHSDYGTPADRTFNYTRTIEDIRGLLSTLRAKYPGTPVYCLGESLGANMALVIGYKMPSLTDGVVLVSPYFGARKFFDPHFLSQAMQVVVRPKSELDMSPYLRKRLSHSPALALHQIKDPMSRDKQTLKELGQSLMLNWSGRRKAKALPPQLAVLIMHGKKDRLCNPNVTAKVFKKIPVPNKQLVLFPESGHLIVEASQVSPPVVNTLSSWVRRQGSMQSARSAPRSAARTI